MARSCYEAQMRGVLARRQEQPAIDFDGAMFTWGDANRVAQAIERMLADAQLPEFARIGLMARNRPMHYAALWGVFVAGSCTAMVHAFQPPRALAQDIAANRFPILLGEPRDWSEAVVAAAEKAGTVGYAFTDDPAAPFARVTRRAEPAPELTAPPAGDTAIELLSSGTTGSPKRIPLSRTSIDELIERTIFQFGSGGAGAEAPQLLAWPLSSLGGTNGGLPAGALGQLLAIQEKFEPHGFLRQLRRYRPTFLSIPSAAMAMLLQLKPGKEDLASIQVFFNGAAPLDPEVRRAMEEDYGLAVANAYGATEFAGIISSWVPEDFALLKAKRGSCGRALPGIQQHIVSPETGAVLGPNEVGLVEALVPRVSHDWVRTNDLAYLDADGFLFLQGRADDAILRGGLKVHPEEVAAMLRTHPRVGDAALIGVPDERLGMVPAAAIEPRLGGTAPTPKELDAWLRERLPAYKCPVRYAIVDELPRTASMKPRREGLRALFA